MPVLTLYDPNYHVGHLFMECMKKRPNAICQIDAATGAQESNESVLQRSVRLARCFRRLGLRPGDVLALGGRNHLDLHIPYYAALMNGLPISGVDPLFKYDEIKSHFQISRPKVAFCEKETFADYKEAARVLELDTFVFTFDGESSMKEFIEKYDDCKSIDDFEPAIFDLDKVYLWLASTGGTGGILKLAAIKHKVWLHKVLNFVMNLYKNADDGFSENDRSKSVLNISPIHWISGLFNALKSIISNQIKVQTSALLTTEHLIDIINNYKPASTLMSPSLITSILKHEKKCDLTSFDSLLITEKCSSILFLVDPVTGKDITAPNTPGELWNKPTCFSEYYNNPDETALVFSEDGYYKTGDILYRDEKDNFFFVERLKMLIKYRNYHIIPLELEEVIRTHPGVQDVSVTGIPHAVDGDWPVACVVTKPGAKVLAKEIEDLVADKLSDSKRLRGGVIFMDQLPYMSTGKLARGKLRQMVIDIKNKI
ncbi:hypothetical protein K1T71_011400 [Dendrolimus kikuchii]|uniref:Uncharacterized protein n=1 Tax=Dendrolimus kikuchii TaxID=765133 RepID=A0ACC1CNM8_9NEOP|nr:hypothetical protein K1T71_011400 [Dendrolimus kikuchii]